MELALGPGRIFVGDPTTADGGDMVDVGDHEDVTFAPNLSTAYATSANSGDQPLPNSLRNRTTMANLTVGLLDISREALLAVLSTHLEEVAADTDSTSGDDAFALAPKSQVNKFDPYTLVFIPEAQLSQGAAAPHSIWLTAAYPQDVSDLFQYGRLSDADNASPHQVTWNASLPGDAVGTDKPWFRGDPAALGLSWSIPPQS